jgi:hypothetical protein
MSGGRARLRPSRGFPAPSPRRMNQTETLRFGLAAAIVTAANRLDQVPRFPNAAGAHVLSLATPKLATSQVAAVHLWVQAFWSKRGRKSGELWGDKRSAKSHSTRISILPQFSSRNPREFAAMRQALLQLPLHQGGRSRRSRIFLSSMLARVTATTPVSMYLGTVPPSRSFTAVAQPLYPIPRSFSRNYRLRSVAI